jgi:hypothetical protein
MSTFDLAVPDNSTFYASLGPTCVGYEILYTGSSSAFITEVGIFVPPASPEFINCQFGIYGEDGNIVHTFILNSSSPTKVVGSVPVVYVKLLNPFPITTFSSYTLLVTTIQSDNTNLACGAESSNTVVAPDFQLSTDGLFIDNGGTTLPTTSQDLSFGFQGSFFGPYAQVSTESATWNLTLLY